MNRRDEYDSYEIEELSDEERASSSSEDELDVLLHGTPDQKRKLLREYLTGESESSSEDEFEKEMTAELDCTLKSLESSWACPVPVAGTSSSREQQVADGANGAQEGKTTEYYEDIYFDSDSDEDGAASSSEKKKKDKKLQRRIPTNDELFYDPDEDDQHQAWMDAQRQGYKVQNKSLVKNQKQKRSRPLPSSDAVLNCPACMTTLCIDCQRHEKYRTQYRAMFVMNCTVNKDEVLKYKMPKERRKNKVKKSGEEKEAQHEEQYHPVKCSECSTEVAVFDKDEVYHFFNILASHC
ncbi:E2F-associated phosphoprotein isoform X1 [Polypterus senegalus]|nr:E2F-associated phosphoprotein isoform X1 [Polypterus senegalus]